MSGEDTGLVVVYESHRTMGYARKGDMRAEVEATTRALWCPRSYWLVLTADTSAEGRLRELFGVDVPEWWPKRAPVLTKAILQSNAIRLAVEDAMTWERYVSGVFAEHAPKEDVSWEPEPSLKLWKPVAP